MLGKGKKELRFTLHEVHLSNASLQGWASSDLGLFLSSMTPQFHRHQAWWGPEQTYTANRATNDILISWIHWLCLHKNLVGHYDQRIRKKKFDSTVWCLQAIVWFLPEGQLEQQVSGALPMLSLLLLAYIKIRKKERLPHRYENE